MKLLDLECSGSMEDLLAFVQAKRKLATRSRVAKHIFMLVMLVAIGLLVAAEGSSYYRRLGIPWFEFFRFGFLGSLPWPLGAILHLAMHGALLWVLYRSFFSSRFPQFLPLLIALAIPFSWVGIVFLRYACSFGFDFVSFVLSYSPVRIPMYGLFQLSPLLGLVAVFVVRWLIGWRWHVIPERLDVAQEILEALRFDCAQGAEATLRLDLHPAYLRRKRVHKAGMKSGTSLYVDPWLSLTMKMNDGNLLVLRTIFQITEKRKSKRKYTKINERFFGAVSVDLRVNRKRYPAVTEMQKIEGIVVDAKFTIVRVAATERRIRVFVRGRNETRNQGRYQSSKDIGTTTVLVEPSIPLKTLSIVYAHLGKMRLPPKVQRKLRKGGSKTVAKPAPAAS